MIVLAQIKEKIQQTFFPLFFEIEDESSLHAGHSGAVPGEITHLRITIVSELFQTMPKIKQHRAVNDCLKDELNSGLHALAIKTLKPEQWNSKNG
jgi:BolA protein